MQPHRDTEERSRVESERKPHVVYVFAHPMSADRLVRGQLAYLRGRGYDVTVICSPGEQLDRVAAREGVQVVGLPMERGFAVLEDLLALARLTVTLRRLSPDIVNAGTTKAGLLGTLAAGLAGVPGRIYVLRGLRLETVTGLGRLILSLTERAASGTAHRVVCNSASLQDRYVEMGFAPRDKTTVLGSGSSNGIDPQTYAVTPERRARAEEMAAGFGIPSGARVVGFVGRLARDKGLDALLTAFEEVCSETDAWLLAVGDFDAADPPDRALVERLRSHPRVVITGHVADPALYYPRMDVLLFPSLREGFPNVPLEAACAEVPVVGYRATGTVDAVVHGKTGLLYDIGDLAGLVSGLRTYIDDEQLRRQHGRAAAERARTEFMQERVWRALEAEYEALLTASAAMLKRRSTRGTSRRNARRLLR